MHLFLHGSTDPGARSAHLKQPLDGLLQAARDSARQSLACGVTLVRDAGDRHGINHRVRAEARLPGSAMAQVRSVIFPSIRSGSMLKVSGSMSANTGFKPSHAMAAGVAA